MVITVNEETKRRFRLLLALLLLALVARAGLELGRKDLAVTGKLRAIRQVETDQKAVALTFDLSWGDHVPERILEALEAGKVKATFFVAGSWADAYPEGLNGLVKAGHELGNLGYEQINYRKHSVAYVRTQIKKTAQAIEAATGLRTRYFRPPNGQYNDDVIMAAAEEGHITVQWDTDSLDWTQSNPEQVVERVLASVHPGDIILFQASDAAVHTPAALPGIIARLKQDGYRLLTLTELMALDED